MSLGVPWIGCSCRATVDEGTQMWSLLLGRRMFMCVQL